MPDPDDIAPTPGPWFNNDGLVSGRDSRERFEGSVSIDIFDAAEWPAELHEEALANAALIAAAPAMAEALERLVRWDDAGVSFQGENLFDDIIPAARAALRLAKGN